MADDERTTTAYAETAEPANEVVVTLRISPSLNDKALSASKASGLKRADIMRLALDRGIDRVLEQLEVKPQPEDPQP